MIKKSISIPIYECKVVVCIDKDINEFAKTLYKKFGMGDVDLVESQGMVVANDTIADTTYYLLLGIDYLNINLLMHETIHLAIRILRHRGHDSLDKGDEPVAYLGGYIAEEVYKTMVKNNIEFKKPKTRRAKES